MAQRSSPWPTIAIIAGILAAIIALPNSYKSWAPSFLKPDIKLGLDLAGGTQLDFRISEDEINTREKRLADEIAAMKEAGAGPELNEKQAELASLQAQHTNLVEAIRTVLERRINSLGVSEATITPSYYGEEKHLLVDCPGVVDPAQCSKTVGKTIQLEFKEEFTAATDEYRAKVRAAAKEVFDEIQSGKTTLEKIGQDKSNDLGVSFADSHGYFRSELPKGLESLWTRRVGEKPVMTEGSISVPRQTADGGYELATVNGVYITEVVAAPAVQERKLTNAPEALKELAAKTPGAVFTEQATIDMNRVPADLAPHLATQGIGTTTTYGGKDTASIVFLSSRVDGKKSMEASHILVSYRGASRAEEKVTRTRAEAQKMANDLRQQLTQGTSFATLAREKSDGPSAREAGKIGKVEQGTWPAAFEAAAFGLKQGEISEVVETPFGFHIIRADTNPVTAGSTVAYSMLTIKGPDAEKIASGLQSQIDAGTVSRSEEQITLRVLFYSLEPTGWKDTDLTGEYFRFASVTTDGVSNVPIVQIQFDTEGGKRFAELTKKNIGKRIAIFVGGELISAPTVQQEITGGSAVITGVGTFQDAQNLAQDLNTGAIPAPIHLEGQHTIEATLGQTALNDSLVAGFVGFIVLCCFMLLIYRLLGFIAIGALVFYIALFIAMMKLPILLFSNQHIVLTLAGIAGIILSIGMAVDANVLIFERMKEEMRKGKNLKTAADIGFKRAWPSIRDGNASTLITCAILFIIGTSIVRGFAVTLSLGLIMSLFTAIIVTRWMLDKIMTSPLAERKDLFGIRADETKE